MTTERSYPQTGTIVGLLLDRALRYPVRPYQHVLRPNGTIDTTTYAEFASRVVGAAEWLAAKGLRRGDRAIIYFDAGEPGVLVYTVTATIGVIAVPLSPVFSNTFLRSLIKQCGASAVITLPQYMERCADVGVPVIDFSQVGTPSVDDWEDKLRRFADEITPETLYMYQPTSGSTGVPKLSMRQHKTFTRAGRIQCAGYTHERDTEECALLAQAMTHGSGQYTRDMALYLGAALAIPTTIDMGIPLEQIEKLKPTFSWIVPRVIRSFIEQHHAKYGDKANATPLFGGRFSWFLASGGVFDEKLLAELKHHGVDVIDAFGATEVSIITVGERGFRKPTFTGPVMPDIQARISTEGELQIKSEFGSVGYYGDPDLMKQQYTADGFFRTGDLAEIDSDGYLRVLGRLHDLFTAAEGSHVFPTRIEDMLEQKPWGGQTILLGHQKPFMIALMVPNADVLAKQGGPRLLDPEKHADLYKTAQQHIAAVNSRLESFEKVRRFVLLGEAFGPQIFKQHGPAKIKRDRNAVMDLFRDEIELLYQGNPHPLCRVEN